MVSEPSPFPLPQDLILNPFVDSGLRALQVPGLYWFACPTARITGFSASENPEIAEKIDAHIARTKRHRFFSQAVAFNSFPVIMEDVLVGKSHMTAKGKCPISGAAGIRLLNRYCIEAPTADFDAEAALTDHFNIACSKGVGASFPCHPGPIPPETPFVIEARNITNCYRFLTETLCQLCLVEEAGVQGQIYIHHSEPEEKIDGFCRAFIDALFPELTDRVSFQPAPARYAHAVGAYNFQASFYLLPAEERSKIDELAPSDYYWKGARGTRMSHAVLKLNSVDSSLFKLRTRALRAIEGKDFSHLPRRFLTTSAVGANRNTPMRGEAELVEMLLLFDFTIVDFERLTPLEQIAMMANAEVMISYNGSSLANMLFAAPEAYVIELGTLQNAVWRWGDFWRLAHVSQCRYISFFADFNKENPLSEPAFNENSSVPVHLSTRGRALVMSFVVSLLGRYPVLPRIQDLRLLVDHLVAAGAKDQAMALLAKNEAMAKTDADLCLFRADYFKRTSAQHAEFLALMDAWAADGSRWQTLIRIIWYGRRVDNTKIVTSALDLLATDFPDRHAALVKSAAWLRKQG